MFAYLTLSILLNAEQCLIHEMKTLHVHFNTEVFKSEAVTDVEHKIVCFLV